MPVRWRPIALVLEAGSLGLVGVAIVWLSLAVVDRQGDPHGYVFLFGSITLVALCAVALIGAVGLVLWSRTGRDTPLIAYDVFAILVAAQFVPSALDGVTESGVVPVIVLGGFVLITAAAAVAVYRTRTLP